LGAKSFLPVPTREKTKQQGGVRTRANKLITERIRADKHSKEPLKRPKEHLTQATSPQSGWTKHFLNKRLLHVFKREQ